MNRNDERANTSLLWKLCVAVGFRLCFIFCYCNATTLPLPKTFLPDTYNFVDFLL
eukprot:m.108423 g.108423  ORF g.108423 m.108423 type:complete len:55 (+) comp22629_c0_seq1:165-329(+)